MEKTQYNVKNIPPELLEKARKLAADSGRPLSLIIRDLLADWVKRQERKQAEPTR